MFCYYLAIELGNIFLLASSNLTPLYFPSGLILAAVLMRGYYLWPGIFLGVFLVNFFRYVDISTFENMSSAMFFGLFNGIGDTVGVLVGGYLIRSRIELTNLFGRVSHVIKFILYGGLLNASISALFGVAGLALAGFIIPARMPEAFLTWWSGDLTGVVIITPLLLCWKSWKDWSWVSKDRLLEVSSFLFCMTMLTIAIFTTLRLSAEIVFPLLLLMPLLTWSALRFPENITHAFVIVVAVIITIATMIGYGPFLPSELNIFFVELQFFLFVVACTTLILLAMVIERTFMEKSLLEREAGFKLMADSSFEGILIHDQGEILEVNKRWLEMYGYENEDQVIGKHILPENIHPESLPTVLKRIETMSEEPYEIDAVRADGSVFPVEFQIRNQLVDGRQLRIASVRDLSETRKQQRNLERAIKKAEKANEAKSVFLSSVSHELRTPLNAILGFSNLLEIDKDELTQAQYEAVQKISLGGKHLLELINEMLDLAKIESGKLTLEMRDIKLQGIVDECEALMSPLAREKGIDLKFKSAEEYVINCDPLRLKQVLLNYLSNAISYNRDGGSIDVHFSEQESARLRITVTDSGIGLNESQVSLLFQPFERIDAEQLGVEGVGIGLAISKNLVELMGGTVGVDSKPGQGSSFWLEVELADGKHDAAEKTLPAADETEITFDDTESSAMSKTVLYIDDNQDNLDLIERVITRLRGGVDVISCDNPVEGLELSVKTNPNLILLDIRMPGMDGYQLLKLLRENAITENTPVIAVSGNAMEDDIERGLEAGFDDYLTKPLDLKKLIALVDRY